MIGPIPTFGNTTKPKIYPTLGKKVHTVSETTGATHHRRLPLGALPRSLEFACRTQLTLISQVMAFLMQKQPISWAFDRFSVHVKRGHDAASTADTIVAVWTGIDSVMRLVIGKGGFNSLFLRSMAITELSYPWLAVSQDARSEVDLQALHVLLLKQDTISLTAASDALMLNFLNMLVDMIGLSLTERLLRPVLDSLLTVKL